MPPPATSANITCSSPRKLTTRASTTRTAFRNLTITARLAANTTPSQSRNTPWEITISFAAPQIPNASANSFSPQTGCSRTSSKMHTVFPSGTTTSIGNIATLSAPPGTQRSRKGRESRFWFAPTKNRAKRNISMPPNEPSRPSTTTCKREASPSPMNPATFGSRNTSSPRPRTS